MEILTAMETLLEKKGWIQKKSKTDKGFCLIGALTEVVRKLPPRDIDAKHSEVWTALQNSLPYGGSVVAFNDQKGRKKEEVLELIRKARG